jgi:hypothetical protein
LHELAYVSNSKPQETSVIEGVECTFQQEKNDPNEIMKPAEKNEINRTYGYQITPKTVSEGCAKNARLDLSALEPE